jgi:hypothetical protein
LPAQSQLIFFTLGLCFWMFNRKKEMLNCSCKSIGKNWLLKFTLLTMYTLTSAFLHFVGNNYLFCRCIPFKCILIKFIPSDERILCERSYRLNKKSKYTFAFYFDYSLLKPLYYFSFLCSMVTAVYYKRYRNGQSECVKRQISALKALPPVVHGT